MLEGQPIINQIIINSFKEKLDLLKQNNVKKH